MEKMLLKLLLMLLILLIKLHNSCANSSKQFGGLNNVTTYEYTTTTDEHQPPHRIVGGQPISVCTTPWQVALINRGLFICGGSIISQNWILTAAHCVVGRGPYSIRAGTRYFKSGGTRRRITTIVIHSRYSRRSSRYDIALLRVHRPIRFRRGVRPVRLAARHKKLPKYFYVSGWGATGEKSTVVSSGLRRVRVALVPKSKCVHSYRSANVSVPKRTICSSLPGKDSCYGDSGGSLVYRNTQYGIVSFGIGCARPRYPGVYTDVRDYRRWISKVMKRY